MGAELSPPHPARSGPLPAALHTFPDCPFQQMFAASSHPPQPPSIPPPPRTAAAVGTSPAASRTGAERCGVGDGKRCGVQPRYAASPPTPLPDPAQRGGLSAMGFPRVCGAGLRRWDRVDGGGGLWSTRECGIREHLGSRGFGMLKHLGCWRIWGSGGVGDALASQWTWSIWDAGGFGNPKDLGCWRVWRS